MTLHERSRRIGVLEAVDHQPVEQAPQLGDERAVFLRVPVMVHGDLSVLQRRKVERPVAPVGHAPEPLAALIVQRISRRVHQIPRKRPARWKYEIGLPTFRDEMNKNESSRAFGDRFPPHEPLGPGGRIDILEHDLRIGILQRERKHRIVEVIHYFQACSERHLPFRDGPRGSSSSAANRRISSPIHAVAVV